MHPALAEASTSAPNDLRTRLGEVRIAIDHGEHIWRIAKVLIRGLPSAADLRDKYLGAHFTVVGSGPSAKDTIDRIPKGSLIVAVNGAHDWLVGRGIIPHFGLLMDPNPWVATYQTPRPDVTYIVGTTCHENVWKRFADAGVKPYVCVPMIDGKDHEDIVAKFPNHVLNFVGGGVTTGLRAVPVFAGLGAGMIDMHGFDSCYAPGTKVGGQLYAHYKPKTYHDAIELTVRSRRTDDSFTCRSNRAMARQIIGFQALCASLSEFAVNASIDTWDGGAFEARDANLCIRMFGDGAIPWMAWKDGSKINRFWHAEPDRMAEKYGDFQHYDYHNDIDTADPAISVGQLLEKSCSTLQ